MNFLAFAAAALVLFSTFAPAPADAQAGPAGRYFGVLHHERIGQDQLAKLDLIPLHGPAGAPAYMAILSLHFGDFRNPEYVSYHFDEVEYDPLAGRLVIDQPDQEVSLVIQRFDGERIEAALNHVSVGRVGNIALSKSAVPAPRHPLIQPVWGEYQGRCGTMRGAADPVSLRLKTYRSLGNTLHSGNPFGAYELRGTFGSSGLCADIRETQAPFCQLTPITQGNYDFLSGEIELVGKTGSILCKTNATGMTCDGSHVSDGSCVLNRVSNEAARATAFTLPHEPRPFTENAGPARSGGALSDSGLSGTYQGYVYHDFLGQYQRMSLNLNALGPGAPGTLNLSAAATLYFGDTTSGERLTYRFQRVEYRLNAPALVARRPDADVDAVLHITELRDGVVRGEWHSLLFGRVGRFEARKQGLPGLRLEAPVFDAIAGEYEYQVRAPRELELYIELRPFRDRTPPNSENPFSPLNFAGGYQFPLITPMTPLDGGTYDFYTGRIGLHGGMFIGSRTGRHALQLGRGLGGAFFSPLPAHELSPMRLRR